MASRRSQRTDDGTPLAIIQEELFELQRQRRQVALSTPPGPPPDMPYYASVGPPNPSGNNSILPTATTTGQQGGSSNFSSTFEENDDDEEKAVRKPVKSALKSPSSKKKKPVAVVDLQDPMDVPYDPSLVQERVSSSTVRKVKFGLMLTLFIFVCMYLYPVLTNVPNEKRMSALTLLAYAIGLGALGAGLSDAFRS